MSYENRRTRLTNRYPTIKDLAKKAKRRIPHVAWEYLETGTGEEELIDRNRSALQQITFIPRFCKGPLKAKTETHFLGKTYAAPFGIAPIGLTGLMWPRIEHYLAATAHQSKIPFCLSALATETPESTGPQVGDMGWFQLYPPRDLDVCKSLLRRAWDSGFHTLVITADVPMAARRERAQRAGLSIPPRLTAKMIIDALRHPVWSYNTLTRGIPRLRTVEHYVNNNNLKFVSGFVGNRLGGTLDWDYCQRLRDMWNGSVILKGILHPQDAVKAVEVGMDALYVSNHGGRQFDGALASIEALPGVVRAVGGNVPVIIDSGIRTGLDIMRALYLGADFIMLGRPFIYGVAALGKIGADHVAHILMDELQNNMVQLGVRDFSELKSADLAK